MQENTSPLAPTAVPPAQSPTYERKVGVNNARRGPLRFEEGIATDTDVPSDFVVGVRNGTVPAPGRPNAVDPNVWYKHADEVMRERAHLGSAAWVEAPSFLGAFSGGASAEAEVRYIQTTVDGSRYERHNPACVND